jgi:hypothetical protein
MTIQQKVTDFLNSVKNEIPQEFFTEWIEKETEKALLNTKLEYAYVDGYGGEGQGEDYWHVYKFTDVETKESCLVKFDGSYYSYNGSSFDRWFFVEPREVVVTQFFEIK